MIIAECGQNHLGDMALARYLIQLAKENGADLVKFQLYSYEALYKDHPEIPDVALSEEQAFMLFNYGKEVGIEVFFSVFDIERVKWCEEMGVKRYKIAARMRDTNVLEAVEATGKITFVSVDPNLNNSSMIKDASRLFCLSEYPARVKFKYLDFPDVRQGFSDHTIGLDAAKIALARGARIIEKHFSIAHHVGIDGQWSMTPSELKELKRWEQVCKEVL